MTPPSGAGPRPPGDGVSRRHFLRVVGTTTLGAIAFTGCKPEPTELMLESRVLTAEDIANTYDNWFATVCRQCRAGCGVVVNVVEGRARKAEGNPYHPVNLGKLCARGQAMVQEEYHPDRLQGPVLRTGPRGSDTYVPISWEEALAWVTVRLRGLVERGRGDAVALLTPQLGGHRAFLTRRFAEALGARRLMLDPLPQTPVRAAVQRVFGVDRIPEFDIANARYVLSFGADFLSTWLSPVHYGVEYGIFRQGRYDTYGFAPRTVLGEPRGRLTHVEPQFSMTAANADAWVPIRPAMEGVLARSIAHVLLAERLVDPALGGVYGGVDALDGYRPDVVAEQVGVPAERIVLLARELASFRPSLVFGGGPAAAQTNGTQALTDVFALNVLLGNVGQQGGVILNPPPPLESTPPEEPASSLLEWQALTASLLAGQVELVLVHDANPVYGLPAALGFGEALDRAAAVVSFSSFLDETTLRADLILPSHLPLEDWGDAVPSPGPGIQVLTTQQPVVRPLYDTRSFWDNLLVLAHAVGGPLEAALPWATMKELVRAGALELLQQQAGQVDEVTFERFWVELLQQGVWWRERGLTPGTGEPVPPIVAGGPPTVEPEFAGDPAEYPFHLIVFSHNTLGDGRTAHLPWLQAAPDPVTTVVWNTWVDVNPRVAERLGIREGDLVAVETPYGRAEIPAYVNPAAPPDVLGVPMGQGHAVYGRWASRRGSNPMSLLAPLVDEVTGALAYAATRARIERVGRRAELAKFEGTVPARQLPGAEVLKVTGEEMQ